jgi:elongator complex protein 3
LRRAARAIIEGIMAGRIRDRRMLDAEKRRLSRELGLSEMPSSPFILSQASPEERDEVLPLLLRKPVRTASGVAVLAVQTSPSQTCPGGCIYCPDFPNAAKSYTGGEPASMRAAQSGFDPYLQVVSRLRQLESMGHETSKVELIVQGATFPAMDLDYRRWFLARCLDGMVDSDRAGGRRRCLQEGIREAEGARARPVGITYETRPDWCTGDHVKEMLALGATRLEIGVQTLSDHVYSLVGRGHDVAEAAKAIAATRGAGLKVCAHMMMGLPGSDRATDLDSFRTLFEDPRFRPDELKIYPTLVIGGTRLHEMWQRGEYKALTDEEVLERLLKVKEMIPPWVRIKRVMRDIPSGMVAAGPRRSDMRSRAQDAMRSRGGRCRCIRCREVGRRAGGEAPELSLHERSYPVDGGIEVFLSQEDKGEEVLAAFLRLSLRPDRCHIRELHTYGRAVRVGAGPSPVEWQHRGIGAALVEEAEARAIDRGASCLWVTSGIGAREYYRRLGYRLRGPYVVKEL